MVCICQRSKCTVYVLWLVGGWTGLRGAARGHGPRQRGASNTPHTHHLAEATVPSVRAPMVLGRAVFEWFLSDFLTTSVPGRARASAAGQKWRVCRQWVVCRSEGVHRRRQPLHAPVCVEYAVRCMRACTPDFKMHLGLQPAAAAIRLASSTMPGAMSMPTIVRSGRAWWSCTSSTPGPHAGMTTVPDGRRCSSRRCCIV